MSKYKKDKIEQHIGGYYSESETYTKILSSICRQLSFAEGALFWFLKEKFDIPDLIMILGFIFLILYFIFDAMQYFVGHVKYREISMTLEKDLRIKKIHKEEHYELPEDFNSSIENILYLKLLFIGISSALLFVGFILSFC